MQRLLERLGISIRSMNNLNKSLSFTNQYVVLAKSNVTSFLSKLKFDNFSYGANKLFQITPVNSNLMPRNLISSVKSTANSFTDRAITLATTPITRQNKTSRPFSFGNWSCTYTADSLHIFHPKVDVNEIFAGRELPRDGCELDRLLGIETLPEDVLELPDGSSSYCKSDLSTSTLSEHMLTQNNHLLCELDRMSNGLRKLRYLQSVIMTRRALHGTASSYTTATTNASNTQATDKVKHPSDGSLQKRSELSKGAVASESCSLEKLETLRKYFVHHFPTFFLKPFDYRMYTTDIVFENNLFKKPYIKRGISKYVLNLSRIRMYGHFMYATKNVNVVKSDVKERDGMVQVQWRVQGIPNSRLFIFWKFRPGTYRDAINKESESWDGLSTFYVNSNGFVYKHRVDKVAYEETPIEVGVSCAKSSSG